ncbi:hypothetical protein DICVIV_13247 [Dictyocaulus viviparus]|uniref:Uncharacterized protein n=1 Tax=Dictyocaulus viviparus TaxID=29172 RepID=A0A0D8X8C6_DICVI|nr:hypothetical protein DICVIV_13247 [Dictyocaulus viviparus]
MPQITSQLLGNEKIVMNTILFANDRLCITRKCVAVGLLYGPNRRDIESTSSEDVRLKFRKSLRDIQYQAATFLSGCFSAEAAACATSKAANLLLVLPTVLQIEKDDVRLCFFAEKTLTELEEYCVSAII